MEIHAVLFPFEGYDQEKYFPSAPNLFLNRILDLQFATSLIRFSWISWMPKEAVEWDVVDMVTID